MDDDDAKDSVEREREEESGRERVRERELYSPQV